VSLTDGSLGAINACVQTLKQNGVQCAYPPLPSQGPAAQHLHGHETLFQKPRQTVHEEELMQRLADSNENKVVVSSLRWGERQAANADILLAADVVYDPDVVPALVQQLVLDLHGPCTALIASVERSPATLATFVDACIACGLHVQELCREPLSQTAAKQGAGQKQPTLLFACAALEQDSVIVLHEISSETRA
jgi:hypothetical protein